MPIYAQLERAIRFAITTGGLRIGDRLPTVRQLAVDLRINANTVAKVYADLEQAGVVETRRGVGTFVRETNGTFARQVRKDEDLRPLAEHFFADAAALGFTVEEALAFLITHFAQARTHGSGTER